MHKTASTTIQNTLFNDKSKLAEAGFLYPEYRAGDIFISNHSIPFYSLFREQPEKYHFNVSCGYTNSEAINTLHEEYSRQLLGQITGFKGETLVISGEDISHLKKDELEKLRIYFLEMTHPGVSFKVVLMCRHPVSRFRSFLQASICNFGITMNKAIEYHLLPNKLYRNLTSNFSEVFGRENISVIKYEDAITNRHGPAGAFLAVIDKDLPDKIKPDIVRENPAHTYETVALLDAVNRTFPQTLGFDLHPERMVALNKLLAEMPGQKFMLPKGLSEKIWQNMAEDVDWLCAEFSLQPYNFLNEDIQEGTEIWNNKTLLYLKTVFPGFSDSQKKDVLATLLDELYNNRKSFTFNKIQQVFAFVMFYSKYLQVGTRFAKFKYFSQAIGFPLSLKLSIYHIVFFIFFYFFKWFSLPEINPRMKEDEKG